MVDRRFSTLTVVFCLSFTPGVRILTYPDLDLPKPSPKRGPEGFEPRFFGPLG